MCGYQVDQLPGRIPQLNRYSKSKWSWYSFNGNKEQTHFKHEIFSWMTSRQYMIIIYCRSLYMFVNTIFTASLLVFVRRLPPSYQGCLWCFFFFFLILILLDPTNFRIWSNCLKDSWYTKQTIQNNTHDTFLDLPKGAKWLLKGVNSPSLSGPHWKVLVSQFIKYNCLWQIAPLCHSSTSKVRKPNNKDLCFHPPFWG